MLSKEHQNFILSEQILANKTAQEWMIFFEEFELVNQKREKNLNFLKKIQLVWFVLLLVIIFGGTSLLKTSENLGFSIIGLLIIFVFLRIEISRNKPLKAKNPNFLSEIKYFVIPLLNILAKDVKEGSSISLQLDLREPFWTADFKKSTFKRNGWDISFHQVPFLKLKAIFEGKIVLDFSIIDKFKRLERWKTSASGKRKNKRKFKGKMTYIAKVAFPKEKYTSKENLAEKKGRMVKVAKVVQINIRENQSYQTKKACEAIAKAFEGIQVET